MKDLKKRSDFWGRDERFQSYGDKTIQPLVNHTHLFKPNSTALEIGPGNGRGIKILKKHVSHFDTIAYSVADIQSNHIDKGILRNCNFILIKDWQNEFIGTFHLIHFWYVIHHVLPEELEDFVNFLDKHLKIDGYLLFNYPLLANSPGDRFGNDGLKTSNHHPDDIISLFSKTFSLETRDDASDNHDGFAIMRKRDERDERTFKLR